AVALELAARLGGEIISVDSMQVYRGLDLGTAKPSAAERARVPHHLVDIADLTESFDVAKFCAMAGEAVEQIVGRGRVPIFCGGTGLYFKAWLEGLGDAPPADAQVRAELEAAPLAELLRELEQRDPVTFAKIDRQNPRRVVRALEVIRLTGKPFSEQRAAWSATKPAVGAESGAQVAGSLFCLGRSPVDLRARMDARVDEMFRRGLVDETRALLARGLEQNRTAMQAIGYRQVVEHLRGERGLAETIGLVKIRTHQFAKRQLTWFRRQLAPQWLDIAEDETPRATAERVLQARTR
ncbi:MAG: tRNA (adenosine(37)-N6)-dimethylallyltransferase MiaA, partial [Verrucomicrobia bacterium]|nr:tRNA (adenosine(37)-N6)-dimethylallyltransferase MiaA [Verrucomicrobiota bacterium]